MGGPKRGNGLEIWLLHRNFEPKTYHRGPFRPKKGPKRGPFQVLGDARGRMLAAHPVCVREYILIQQFTNKWLRKSVYNDKYTFNTLIETIVDNNNSDTTNKHKTTCARSEHACTLVDVCLLLSLIHHSPHGSRPFSVCHSILIPSMCCRP